MKIKYRMIGGRITPVAVVTNSFDETRARKLGFRHVEFLEPVGYPTQENDVTLETVAALLPYGRRVLLIDESTVVTSGGPEPVFNEAALETLEST